jgi:L-ascorbate metabolism protein UlaG (beta-lactamase superfamily)
MENLGCFEPDRFRRASLLAVALALSSLAWTATPPDTFQTSAGPVTLTPIKHASFTLQAGGKIIYIDPSPEALFSGRPKADLILITDIHGDHMDPGAVSQLKKDGTHIIAPAAVAKTITDLEVLANGQQTTWGGWSIEAVPMYNLKRGPTPGKLYHDKGRGNGYILTYGGKRFYIAGDTEGIPEMRNLKNIDVAFVPMNLPYTMPPEEAADAVKAFHPKIVYPYHYRGSDIKKFEADVSGTGIEVRLRAWYSE